MSDQWAGLQYTSVYSPDGRSGSGLQYTSPHPGVTQTSPAPAVERRPARSGDPAAPYTSRLRGLKPRSTADWSAFIGGRAIAFGVRLSNGRGGTEEFSRACFAEDHNVEVPLLVSHDPDVHVGWVRFDCRPDGLHFHGQIRRGAMRTIGTRRSVSLGFLDFEHVPDTGGHRRFLPHGCLATEVSLCERGAHHPHSYADILAPARLAVAA